MRGLRPPWHFDAEPGDALLTAQFGTRDLAGFGAAELTAGLGAAGALLQYAQDTQKAALPHIRALSVQQRDEDCSWTRPRAATWSWIAA